QVFKEETGVLNPDISSRIGKPEQRIIIDRDKAASFGLSVTQVATALRVSLEGDDTPVYREGGNEYKIRVHFSEELRKNMNQVPDIVVGSTLEPNGTLQPVRLAEVAQVFPAE